MRCSSPAFLEGKPIPTKYAHRGVTGGKNISIPLTWEDVPSGTKSFALSIVDPHPVANNWIHWFVINIPQSVNSLAEGLSLSNMPGGSMELFNSYGEKGYGGPEPPKGTGPHPYVTTVYALDTGSPDIGLNATLRAFEKSVGEHCIASAKLTGFYER